MGLLDIDIRDVLITKEGLLDNGFREEVYYMSGYGTGRFLKTIPYQKEKFYFKIEFYVTPVDGNGWNVKFTIGDHRRLIDTWHGDVWQHQSMMSVPMKPLYITDMQLLQLMMTKEWLGAWMVEEIKNHRLQFEYSEMFKTY